MLGEFAATDRLILAAARSALTNADSLSILQHRALLFIERGDTTNGRKLLGALASRGASTDFALALYARLGDRATTLALLQRLRRPEPSI